MTHKELTILEKIYLGDILLLASSELLGISTNYTNDGLMDIDGNDMEWDDMCALDIEPLQLSDCVIDGIIMFGDGTLEFRQNDNDAVNWCEFNVNDLKTILNEISKLLSM